MNSNGKTYVGRNIRHLRRSHNLTLEELGKKLNKGLSTVGKWETGDSQPTLDILIELMNIFNVSLDNLIFVDLEQYKGDYSVSAFLNHDVDTTTSNGEEEYINEFRKLDDDHKQRLAEIMKFYLSEQKEE